MAKCRHLSISEEAYRVDANGEEPAAVFLCGWPQQVKDMPRWADRLIGGGIRIDHKQECLACPGYEKHEASHDQ